MGAKSHSEGDQLGELSYEADLCGNIEQALKGLQGYGLMALELIQNADDAGARLLSFDATARALMVQNDAQFTSCGLNAQRCPWEREGDPDGNNRPCNFHAISRMGSRNKLQVDGQTGRFGIGFVSVYQITDLPAVRSAGTQIVLNPLMGKVSKTSIDTTTGTEFELPWASQQSEIRDALNASPTPPDVVQRLVAELCDVLRTSLLFLRHLETVEVHENGRLHLAAKIHRSGEEIILTFQPKQTVEKWLVLSRDADDIIAARGLLEKYAQLRKLNRSTRVGVALALDAEPDSGLIYAYLPTRQKSGMPLHINGDFFPHASRQNIVREGEGHERYWNEALLATAATIVGERFESLKDILGHKRLWRLGMDAFELRNDKAFGAFWRHFEVAAKSTDSVWTTLEEWETPSIVHWSPDVISVREQAAVVSFGIVLLHPDLRSSLNAFSAVGVRELRLSVIVAALANGDGAAIEEGNPKLRLLWDAIAALIAYERERGDKQLPITLENLKGAKFLIDLEGNAVTPNEVWKTAIGVFPTDIKRFVPTCIFVHSDVVSRQGLADLIDSYELDNFANDLALLIKSEKDADQVVGSASCQALYSLMLAFGARSDSTDAGTILFETPFLWTGKGFASPLRARLPGGFHDPMGYLELVDLSFFPADGEHLLRDIFKVEVLSFRDYIDGSLEELLTRGPTREQYVDLISQIAQKRYELDESGALDLLADRDFVRTRAGNYMRPSECYYWKAELEVILGADLNRWVDDDWMPSGRYASKMRDLLEGRLGMPTVASPRHIVHRIEELAEGYTPDEVVKPLTLIMRYLIERWGAFTAEDLDILEPLKELEYLPAEIDGELDKENLYAPNQVYRVTRSKGFESQVSIVALSALRQSSIALNEVLDFLEIPEEPATSVVVTHLRHCMEAQIATSEVTYAILSERFEKGDNVDVINALSGAAFIYNRDLDRYLRADQVFWESPPIGGGYWWRASDRMMQYRALFSALGVQDRPGPTNYAGLIRELAVRDEFSEDDLRIYDHCLTAVCEALQDNSTDAVDAVQSLKDVQSLLNVDGSAIFPDDAIWIDVDLLASPFGSDLNEYLVRPPALDRSLVARFFRRLDVPPISEVAHRLLAEQPDCNPDEAAMGLLNDRKDLLLWLLQARSRRAFNELVPQLCILTSASVIVRTEIAFEPPVLSPPTEVKAFLDKDRKLYVEASSFRRGWTVIFREVFSTLNQQNSLDIAPLVFAANQIMQSATRDEAEAALRDAGFTPPSDVLSEITLGETLRDDATAADAAEDEQSDYRAVESENDFGVDEHRDDSSDVGSDSGSDGEQGRAAQDTGPQSGALGTDIVDGAKQTVEQQNDLAGNSSTATDDRQKAHPGAAGSNSIVSGQSDTSKSDSGQHATPRTSGATRTSRMTTYVARSGDRPGNDGEVRRDVSDETKLIDIAAIKAALRYEEANGREAKEQPHTNPGFDIVSTAADGTRRIIEVKGLAGEWTDRGTKLTRTQYTTAGEYRDEYWLYVVENAPESGRQWLSAIKNPFSQVDEYWFDQNWRDASEESVNLREINMRRGSRVRHKVWGNGTVIEARRIGFDLEVTINFGRLNGKKAIRYNSDLELLLD